MGVRNLLIVFFSTVADSLVVLIIFFNLFFKNVDLSFNTKTPEGAPTINGAKLDPNSPEAQANQASTESSWGNNPQYLGSASSGRFIMRSHIKVPPEYELPAPVSKPSSSPAATEAPTADANSEETPTPTGLPVAKPKTLPPNKPLPADTRLSDTKGIPLPPTTAKNTLTGPPLPKPPVAKTGAIKPKAPSSPPVPTFNNQDNSPPVPE